ncbi:MAG: hypothetical protein GY861_03375 [bacterium]|nr:hypothetical protein [bacterium]
MVKNQKSDLSIPLKWQERFLIKRIGEEDIEISLIARDEILKALNDGARFIQIGKYTLMLNSIKSIDPLWGKNNIPPRPELKRLYGGVSIDGNVEWSYSEKSQKEVDLWDKFFKGKLI